MTAAKNEGGASYKYRRERRPDNAYSKTALEYADVSMPVDLIPYVRVDRVTYECCGEPTAECDTSSGSCRITMSQTMKIKVDAVFGVMASPGEAYVKCTLPPDNTDGEKKQR